MGKVLEADIAIAANRLQIGMIPRALLFKHSRHFRSISGRSPYGNSKSVLALVLGGRKPTTFGEGLIRHNEQTGMRRCNVASTVESVNERPDAREKKTASCDLWKDPNHKGTQT